MILNHCNMYMIIMSIHLVITTNTTVGMNLMSGGFNFIIYGFEICVYTHIYLDCAWIRFHFKNYFYRIPLVWGAWKQYNKSKLCLEIGQSLPNDHKDGCFSFYIKLKPYLFHSNHSAKLLYTIATLKFLFTR